MECSLLAHPVGLLKLMLNLFCTSNIQEKELCWRDFIKYMINIVVCRDACEPICFKLDVMLGMTKLYNLIPVWMTLVFTQGHRIMGKLEFELPLFRKVALSNSSVHEGWLCKGDDCEEVLYG